MRPSTLLLAAALLGSASALPAQSRRDRDHDRDHDRDRDRGTAIDTTIAFTRSGVVDLSLVSGEITVTASDRQEVRIRARSERGELRLNAGASRISLEVGSRHGGEARFDVQVPVGARVLARTTSGDIDVRDTRGDLDARTVSGDIDVQNVGAFDFESVSGNVLATGIGGAATGSSVSGEIELSDVGGDVRAESTSGDVVLSNVRARLVRSESVSGNIEFSGSVDRGGSYEFTSHSGNITLGLPADVGAQVGVETFSGEIESDFPLVMNPTDDRGRRRRLEFTLGGGGARITASSFSGNIDLERGIGRDATKE